MKTFIIGIAILILSIMIFSFQHDSNLNRHFLNELKVSCEEASVAGALFVDETEYSEGHIVFNQVESIRAIEAVIKETLYLNDDFTPKAESYWTQQVSYTAYFYDDNNTTYPELFTDSDTGFTYVVKAPTVIVTINAGSAPYHLDFLKNLGTNVRSAAHTWDGR